MIAFAWVALFGLVLLLLLLRVLGLASRLDALARRIETLERELSALRTGPRVVPGESAAPPPAPLPMADWTRAPAGAPRPEAARARAGSAPSLERMEQLVGGVWLQNLGAVLVLVGIFLMIVWGYGAGRFGPGVLVSAGVLLGLALAWRGDRVARSMPSFGHALIGLGLGVVYLTLDLGFVRLHVLGAPLALVLLALVSFGSIAAGLRYRVQTIAALGVIGAFLPQFLAAWLGLGGFHLGHWTLFAYVAVVDALVFALTWRAGWSALDLAALVLGALAWVTGTGGSHWGWPLELALAAQYTLLGLAPLPRLVGAHGRVRAIDLAVVVVAPLVLLGLSAAFLVRAGGVPAGMLLLGLAAVFTGAAAWTDARRPERDLWAPLTGAATLLVTAALERSLAPEVTPLAWCAEGVVLLWLGLRPRAGALRVGGHAVLLAGAAWACAHAAGDPGGDGWRALADPGLLRALGAAVALLLAAVLLAEGRARLAPLERHAPELWGALGNVALAACAGLEAGRAARVAVGEPAFAAAPGPLGGRLAERRETLAASLRIAWWSAQAALLVDRGAAVARALTRAGGYVLGLAALAVFALWPAACAGWGGSPPFVHVTALLALVAVMAPFAVSARLAAVRVRLPAFESRTPEVAAAVACLALALWGARESAHLARATLGVVPGAGVAAGADVLTGLETRSAAFTSGFWLLEAVALLVTGWARGSAFLRWCALTLLGVTVLKFVAFDLRSVDVFWRFLTAIAVGVAMLALSWAYQRRSRSRTE